MSTTLDLFGDELPPAPAPAVRRASVASTPVAAPAPAVSEAAAPKPPAPTPAAPTVAAPSSPVPPGPSLCAHRGVRLIQDPSRAGYLDHWKTAEEVGGKILQSDRFVHLCRQIDAHLGKDKS